MEVLPNVQRNWFPDEVVITTHGDHAACLIIVGPLHLAQEVMGVATHPDRLSLVYVVAMNVACLEVVTVGDLKEATYPDQLSLEAMTVADLREATHPDRLSLVYVVVMNVACLEAMTVADLREATYPDCWSLV
jgi:hypothetical protein